MHFIKFQKKTVLPMLQFYLTEMDGWYNREIIYSDIFYMAICYWVYGGVYEFLVYHFDLYNHVLLDFSGINAWYTTYVWFNIDITPKSQVDNTSKGSELELIQHW